jgi:hypothetical protein
MRKEIYVKDLGQFMSNKKDKTIKAIMKAIEEYIESGTKTHSKIRNEVLDNINDFYADICLAVENHENGSKNVR